MDFHLTSSQFPSLRTFPPNSRNRLGRTPHSEPSIAGARVITCVSWSLQWCMQQKHARFFSLLFFLFFFFSPVHQEIPDSFPPRLSSDTFIVSSQSTFIRGHRRNSAIYPLLSPLMGEGGGEGLSRLSEAKLYFSTGNDGIPRPIPSSRIIN